MEGFSDVVASAWAFGLHNADYTTALPFDLSVAKKWTPHPAKGSLVIIVPSFHPNKGSAPTLNPQFPSQPPPSTTTRYPALPPRRSAASSSGAPASRAVDVARARAVAASRSVTRLQERRHHRRCLQERPLKRACTVRYPQAHAAQQLPVPSAAPRVAPFLMPRPRGRRRRCDVPSPRGAASLSSWPPGRAEPFVAAAGAVGCAGRRRMKTIMFQLLVLHREGLVGCRFCEMLVLNCRLTASTFLCIVRTHLCSEQQ
ncbi:uncharacterized protein [Miscanthus floridulus]|uniref:uncharacterized protein n=1 Tax=Miscanthus floridulus TaxID=154761 RepID=UPI003458DE91